VPTNVIFENLRSGAIDSAPHLRQEHQPSAQSPVVNERSIESNLPTNPLNASYQPLLFFSKSPYFFLAYMLGGYDIRLESRFPSELNGELQKDYEH
jgi:hypothetical protein